ncbi:hypothetical protein AAMO2058_000662700 [Amorphochlora amoebiformis]
MAACVGSRAARGSVRLFSSSCATKENLRSTVNRLRKLRRIMPEDKSSLSQMIQNFRRLGPVNDRDYPLLLQACMLASDPDQAFELSREVRGKEVDMDAMTCKTSMELLSEGGYHKEASLMANWSTRRQPTTGEINFAWMIEVLELHHAGELSKENLSDSKLRMNFKKYEGEVFPLLMNLFNRAEKNMLSETRHLRLLVRHFEKDSTYPWADSLLQAIIRNRIPVSRKIIASMAPHYARRNQFVLCIVMILSVDAAPTARDALRAILKAASYEIANPAPEVDSIHHKMHKNPRLYENKRTMKGGEFDYYTRGDSFDLSRPVDLYGVLCDVFTRSLPESTEELIEMAPDDLFCSSQEDVVKNDLKICISLAKRRRERRILADIVRLVYEKGGSKGLWDHFQGVSEGKKLDESKKMEDFSNMPLGNFQGEILTRDVIESILFTCGAQGDPFSVLKLYDSVNPIPNPNRTPLTIARKPPPSPQPTPNPSPNFPNTESQTLPYPDLDASLQPAEGQEVVAHEASTSSTTTTAHSSDGGEVTTNEPSASSAMATAEREGRGEEERKEEEGRKGRRFRYGYRALKATRGAHHVVRALCMAIRRPEWMRECWRPGTGREDNERRWKYALVEYIKTVQLAATYHKKDRNKKTISNMMAEHAPIMLTVAAEVGDWEACSEIMEAYETVIGKGNIRLKRAVHTMISTRGSFEAYRELVHYFPEWSNDLLDDLSEIMTNANHTKDDILKELNSQKHVIHRGITQWEEAKMAILMELNREEEAVELFAKSINKGYTMTKMAIKALMTGKAKEREGCRMDQTIKAARSFRTSSIIQESFEASEIPMLPEMAIYVLAAPGRERGKNRLKLHRGDILILMKNCFFKYSKEVIIVLARAMEHLDKLEKRVTILQMVDFLEENYKTAMSESCDIETIMEAVSLYFNLSLSLPLSPFSLSIHLLSIPS